MKEKEQLEKHNKKMSIFDSYKLSTTTDSSTGIGVHQIDIRLLNPDPAQPRHHFDPESLEELAQSIRTYGILQPIIVTPDTPPLFRIIAGERRWRASLLAGLSHVPCIVHNSNDHPTLELALVENIQRQELSPVEEARALRQILDGKQMTQDTLAQRIGKDRSTIANLLRILSLPATILEDIETKRISLGHAKVLLTISDSKMQMKLREKIVTDNLSVRQAENAARQLKETPQPTGNTRREPDPIPPHLRILCDQLKGHLGTRVRITGDTEQGKIEITYFSAEDLERIADLVLGGSLDNVLKSD